MKNLLIKRAITLHELCHRKKNPSNSSRYLIFSTTGVGDTLWGTPAIRAIKKHNPNAHLSVLTSPMGKQLLLNNPYIDQLITIKEPELRKKIQSIKADTAIIFHISQRVMMPLSYLSKASHIIGSAGINKGLDSILTECVEKNQEHEIARRLRLVEKMGIPPTGNEMEIFLTESERKKVAKFPGPILAIHPGSKDRFKQYPPHLFAKAAKNFQGTILITGGKEEVALCESVAKEIPGSISLAGKLSLRALAALIESVDLFLTNDTGPMHIAFSMKTKTIALFGPTDLNLCGPYDYKNATVLRAPPTCTPCLKKKCQDPFCMRQISPSQITEAF